MELNDGADVPEDETIDILIKVHRRDNTTNERRVKLATRFLSELQDRLTADPNIREVEILKVEQLFRSHKSFAEDLEPETIMQRTHELLRHRSSANSFDVV